MSSVPLGLIFRDIQRAQRLSDFGFREDLGNAALLASGELSRVCDWVDLREELTIVYDGANAVMLPADVVGVLAVLDSENALVRRAENYTVGMEDDENFYALKKCSAPILSGKGVNIDKGSDRISGITLTSTHDDEWIEFGDQPGCYKISVGSTGTLSEPYWGPKISGGYYTVRPRDTRFIEFGEAGTYRVVVWHEERPLYEDHQRTVLPARPFQLAIIVHVLGFHEKQKGEADAYRAEYRQALSDAMNQNPRYTPPAGAVVNRGYAIRFGRSFE